MADTQGLRKIGIFFALVTGSVVAVAVAMVTTTSSAPAGQPNAAVSVVLVE
jgi:hypothetical protein